jgi:hypothetical protein
MGNTNVNKQATLEVNVLITLIGELGEVDEEFKIDEVEVITTREVIDFGQVEPDMMYEYYEY